MGLNTGMIAKLLNFRRTESNGAKVSLVEVNTGGGAIKTTEHFAAVGDDSHPLRDDYCVTVAVRREGGFVTVGYIDPKNEQKAAAGDKRIYARNASGTQVCEVWLHNDGRVELVNANGFLRLNANGDVVIGAVTIKQNGEITTSGDITTTGTVTGDVVKDGTVVLGTHTHTGGTISGNTGAPNE